MHTAASKAGVLERDLLDKVKRRLSAIKPMKAVFDRNYVKKIDGPNIKKGKNKVELAEQLRQDIRDFRKSSGASRLITMWCASTESFLQPTAAHQSLKALEKAMKENDETIAPSMVYAYASLMEDVPFANGAPNLTLDIPAMRELAQERELPICGKDFKTGQTLMKSVLAPAFKACLLGLNGWYSTNILGNRDGEVLDDPGSFKTKEESKLGLLEHILQPQLYPELYGKIFHKVRINYYPPRGDNKEGWDNIDIFGWRTNNPGLYANPYQAPRPLPCITRWPFSRRWRKCCLSVFRLVAVSVTISPMVTRPCSRAYSRIFTDNSGMADRTIFSLSTFLASRFICC